MENEKLSAKEWIKRYLLFLIGLFIAALGVAMSTKAGLGTSPVSTVPYTLSLIITKVSFGTLVTIYSLVQIAIQVILIRKKCRIVDIIIQVILAFVFGYMTSFCCSILDGLNPSNYICQLLLMFASCFVVAFGIWLQLKGKVAMLAGEAMNRAISSVTGFKFENVKIFFDVVYILASVAISFIATGQLQGVREGSVIAAIVIGNIIRLYNKLFDKITAKPKA